MKFKKKKSFSNPPARSSGFRTNIQGRKQLRKQQRQQKKRNRAAFSARYDPSQVSKPTTSHRNTNKLNQLKAFVEEEKQKLKAGKSSPNNADSRPVKAKSEFVKDPSKMSAEHSKEEVEVGGFKISSNNADRMARLQEFVNREAGTSGIDDQNKQSNKKTNGQTEKMSEKGNLIKDKQKLKGLRKDQEEDTKEINKLAKLLGYRKPHQKKKVAPMFSDDFGGLLEDIEEGTMVHADKYKTDDKDAYDSDEEFEKDMAIALGQEGVNKEDKDKDDMEENSEDFELGSGNESDFDVSSDEYQYRNYDLNDEDISNNGDIDSDNENELDYGEYDSDNSEKGEYDFNKSYGDCNMSDKEDCDLSITDCNALDMLGEEEYDSTISESSYVSHHKEKHKSITDKSHARSLLNKEKYGLNTFENMLEDKEYDSNDSDNISDENNSDDGDEYDSREDKEQHNGLLDSEAEECDEEESECGEELVHDFRDEYELAFEGGAGYYSKPEILKNGQENDIDRYSSNSDDDEDLDDFVVGDDEVEFEDVKDDLPDELSDSSPVKRKRIILSDDSDDDKSGKDIDELSDSSPIKRKRVIASDDSDLDKSNEGDDTEQNLADVLTNENTDDFYLYFPKKKKVLPQETGKMEQEKTTHRKEKIAINDDDEEVDDNNSSAEEPEMTHKQEKSINDDDDGNTNISVEEPEERKRIKKESITDDIENSHAEEPEKIGHQKKEYDVKYSSAEEEADAGTLGTGEQLLAKAFPQRKKRFLQTSSDEEDISKQKQKKKVKRALPDDDEYSDAISQRQKHKEDLPGDEEGSVPLVQRQKQKKKLKKVLPKEDLGALVQGKKQSEALLKKKQNILKSDQLNLNDKRKRGSVSLDLQSETEDEAEVRLKNKVESNDSCKNLNPTKPGKYVRIPVVSATESDGTSQSSGQLSDGEKSQGSAEFSEDENDSPGSAKFSEDENDSPGSAKFSEDENDSSGSAKFSEDENDSPGSAKFSEDENESPGSAKFSEDESAKGGELSEDEIDSPGSAVFSDDEEHAEDVKNMDEDQEREEIGLTEDIYGRLRDEEGNVVKNKDTVGNGKYVPPALRKLMALNTSDKKKEELAKLKKILKGLLNRLAESNMAGIANQIEGLYIKHSRNDMSDTLTNLFLESLVAPTLTPERLVQEHAMLVAILSANVGTEVGGHIMNEFVIRWNDEMEQLVPDENVSSKEVDNLLLVIANLYNFRVTDPQLIYDILHKLVAGFTNKEVELILLVLRSVGFTLRKDDPLALKSLITKIQAQASVSQAENVGSMEYSRVRFMLEVLQAIRNNNMAKMPNYDPSHVEHLKKVLKGLVRKGNQITPLNVSLEDLLKARECGRWWIVGSAWSGDLPGEKPPPSQNILHSGTGTKALEDKFSEKFKERAAKLQLSRPPRINILYIITEGSEDYLDAFEKLLQLSLPHQQERELFNVIILCSQKSKVYNPFFAHLADRMCKFDKKYKRLLQFALWDKFTVIETMKPRETANLAKFVTHLIGENSLNLSVLKNISFMEVDSQMISFLRQTLIALLLHPAGADAVEHIFSELSSSPKLHMLRQSLRIFILKFLSSKKNKENTNHQMLCKRIQDVTEILSRGGGVKL